MIKENLPLGLFEKHRDALAARGFVDPVVFETDADLFVARPAPIDCALVFLPKSKALINMTLSLVSGLVREGGMVVLAGSNDAGIRSAKESYEKYLGPVSEKIVGNHSALYVGTNARLGADKKAEDFLSFSPLEYGDLGLQVATLPGVFSAHGLDEGTKLLLDKMPFDKKSMLDVGCGAGIIGTIYKKKNPAATVTMADVSPLAVLASRRTLERNALADSKTSIVQSDVFSYVAGTFDLIVSNPPFHKGVGTDYSFIETFARDAKRHLNKGGEVWIVANSFLPYKDTLDKHIGPTEIVADDNKFRVYRTAAR